MSTTTAKAGSIRAAVDVGGTFTDVQILNMETDTTWALKTPTTPDNPGRGIVTGLAAAAARFDFELSDIGTLMHGTTIATNAVLEQKLADGALITTAGFEDVLEIGRHVRRDIYSSIAETRTLLIPRAKRFGVIERTAANGSIETALDETSVARVIAAVRASGVSTVAVCLLHAYANPAHEQALIARLQTELPDLSVCASHVVSPELREFERTSTTVLNALLMPVIGAYLAQLEQRLSAAGINAPLYLFQSNGGVLPPLKAAQLPVRLLLSGPAGGALAVRTLGNLGAEANLVGIDMGGTSFDVCVVESGTTREITQGEVANCPVRVPMTEIRTISAGGGSIACVDSAGRALVGPHSAGAIPGPAAYGHGGQHATVTDANVVLGRLSPAQFLDGEMPLDVDAATQVVNTTVAEPLNISPEDAAAGVLRVAVAQMAAAIRLSLFEKGLDPRDFALMSFGGAAGLHAAEVAEELGASRVLYPADSATLSAWGMLHADITHDLAATRLLSVTAKTAATINELVAPLVEMATASLHDEGLADDDIHLSLAADMRYRGQAYEIPVPWDALSVSPEVVESACARFHAMHEASFAHSDSNATPELLTVRVRGVGRLTQPGKLSNHPAQSASVVSPRRVYHAGAWQQLPVYTRAHLADVFASEAFHGPLVVEDRHTTIVVPDGWAISAADAGCLMAQRIRADGPTTAASAEDQSA